MRLNTALVARNLARVFRRGPIDIHARAVERRELCPAETCPGRPALFPEGALDHISKLSPWCDWDSQRDLITGAPAHHAATEAFVLRGAVLAGAFLYHGAAKARVGHGTARMLDPDLPPRRVMEEAHLAATWTGADFFGSFMRDSLTLEMIPPPGSPRLGAPVKPYAHAPGYRVLLDLPAPETGHVRVERLTIYRDFGQNSFKVARYRTLRARLRARLPATAPPGIFLRRSTDGEPRRLVNEGAVADLLAARGFDILDHTRLEPAEIARRALDARLVVAIEGSHLAHAIHTLADDGAFLVIQPPDRFALPYKEFADCMGMRFGFVVARPAEDGFAADLDEIRLMLDRLS